MKILIVGSDKIFAIENFYVKYLRALGNEVLHFPANSKFIDYYNSKFVNKLLFKAGLSPIYRHINLELRSVLARERPDIAWVFKGMEIFPDTLNFVRSLKIPVVNFNGDNPFIFTGKGSGNQNVTKSLEKYDLHFTYNTSVALEFNRRALKTSILPFGFDLDMDVYARCLMEKEIFRVCFLGNPDSERSHFIKGLAEANIPVTVYGTSWEKFLDHPDILINPPVLGEEQWRVLRRYRVQLNLMRMHNPDSHNMRSFEVPGIGGIMLAPDTPEHRTFFEDGKEVFLFKGLEDCVAQANKILSLPATSAYAVRTAARERSLASGYRYEDRTKQALQVLKTLLP